MIDCIIYTAGPIDESKNEDGCHGCYDLQTWHEILGHCNYDDVLKLESVTLCHRGDEN